MNNEKSYYDRMSSTMNDKCKTILPFLYEGVRVLDFGAGCDLSIAQLVSDFNGYYCAVDQSLQVIDFFSKNNRFCYSDISLINESFNVIFMSSVYHELISYLGENETNLIFKHLSNLLSSNGKIIIRDWNVLQNDVWNENMNLSYDISKTKDINTWINSLKNNKIISSIDFNSGVIFASRKDIYNIIYHVTWGLQSLERECRESYSISFEQFNYIISMNGLKLVENITKWDDSYINYVKMYFPEYSNLVLMRNEWIAPKMIIVLQKL